MAIIALTDLAVGQRIQFRTINDHDNVLWLGTISAIGNYQFAQNVQDLVPYYQQILKIDATIPTLEESTFIQLTTLENYGTPSSVRVFARDWIDLTSLTLVEDLASIYIKVYGVTTQGAADIINLLRNAGYTAQQVSTTSS